MKIDIETERHLVAGSVGGYYNAGLFMADAYGNPVTNINDARQIMAVSAGMSGCALRVTADGTFEETDT